jgi:VWFA-related protein
LLDARQGDFRVEEYGRPVVIESFQAPQSVEIRPTTVALVLDRSGSMHDENRIGALKEAVSTFLETVPPGSKVAVFAFSTRVRRLCDFTDDVARVRAEVQALQPGGVTRFYDAVAEALDQIADQPGRRAVLALTDGMDNASQEYDLPRLIQLARRRGVPVHTVGVGTETEIASEDLQQLAEDTRGQYFPVRKVDQLRSIYEELARRLGESYSLTYRTDRRLPDGTLRPVSVAYRESTQAAQAQVYVRGMIVPAGGWSRLFLVLMTVLAVLAFLPSWRTRRPKLGSR